MRKKIKLMILLISILILSAIVINKDKIATLQYPSREIKIGYPDEEHPKDMINFKNSINDYKDQHKVDLLESIIYGAKEVNNPNVEIDNPSLYIMIDSPREGICLLAIKLWFLEGKTVIGSMYGEDHENEYKQINPQDTKTLKAVINFNEKG